METNNKSLQFFSIIIPCHNSIDFIELGLLPLLEFVQQSQNVEILFVDDGSSDDTLQKLNSFQSNYPRIKVFSNKVSKGPNFSRNIGIQNATGDYILFLDCDDQFELETLFYLINSEFVVNYEMINFGIKFINQLGNINKKFISKQQELCNNEIVELFLGGSIPKVCWNKAYSREFLIKNNIKFIPDKVHGRDTLFTLECIKLSRRILLDEHVLVNSIIRNKSFSRNYSIKNIQSAIVIINDLDSYLSVNFDNNDEYFSFVHKYIRYTIIVSIFRMKDFRDFKKGFEEIKTNKIARKYLLNNRGLAPLSLFIFFVNISPQIMFNLVKVLKKYIKNPY